MKKFLVAILVVCTLFTFANAQNSAPALMQLTKLTDANGIASEKFGTYSAISGNTAVVATTGSSVDVFVKGASGWVDTPAAILAGSDGSVGLTNVAISGNTVVAEGVDISKLTLGTYIFEKPSGGWSGTVTETAILGASGLAGISGDTVVVGSAGSYQIFVRPSGGWKSTSQPNATLFVPFSYSYYYSVAIGTNTIVVGQAGNFNYEGTVYVYSRPSGGWSGTVNPTATLLISNQRPGDGLGWSVAISGNTIVAGATGVSQSAGAAYVYVEPAGGWTDTTETAKLTSAATYEFGWSVGVSANAVVVGAPFNTVGFNQFQGAAYVYVKPASGWKSTSTANAELIADDGAANDLFGSSTLMSGSTILGTAPNATIGSNYSEGAVYVFGK